MNNSIYRATLDVHTTSSQYSFPMSQNDSARQLIFTFMDGGKPYEIPSGVIASFRCVVNGNHIANSATISGNTVTVDIGNSITGTVGVIPCEVRLFQGQAILTSPRFDIVVEGILFTDAGEIGSDTFNELTDALTDVNEAIDACDNLDIDSTKTGNKLTVILTDKDGAVTRRYIYDGVGITSIAKTSTSGLKDTYTITFTDGTTTTFKVTNGEDGTDGVSVTNATIDANGHLVVTLSSGTTIDCGNAKGAQGEAGADGADGEDGTDATINGVNALTLNTGTYIDLTQSGNTATLGLDIDELETRLDDDGYVYSGATHQNNQIAVWSGSTGCNIKASNKKVADLQEKLIAGENITIAADGKTISATGGSATWYKHTMGLSGSQVFGATLVVVNNHSTAYQLLSQLTNYGTTFCLPCYAAGYHGLISNTGGNGGTVTWINTSTGAVTVESLMMPLLNDIVTEVTW